MRPTPQNRLRAAGCISVLAEKPLVSPGRAFHIRKKSEMERRASLDRLAKSHERFAKPEREAQRLRELGGRPRSPEEEKEFREILRLHRHLPLWYFESRAWEKFASKHALGKA